MSKPAKISVLIPVYNAEKYLRECLDSVINQTYENLEIICVNDGSTDSSLDILHEYSSKDSRIIVVNQENKGNSIARNVCFKHMTGKYFMFLDADDYMSTKIVAKLYSVILKTKSDFVMCSTKVFSLSDSDVVVDRKNRLKKYFNNFEPVENFQVTVDNYYMVLKNLSVVPWGKLYKTKYVKKHKLKFFNGRSAHDDEAFFMKMISTNPKFTLIKDIGVYYRITDTSISAVAEKQKDVNRMNYAVAIIDAKKYIKKRCNAVDYDIISSAIAARFRGTINSQIYRDLLKNANKKKEKKKYFYKYKEKSHDVYNVFGVKFKFKTET